MERYLRRIRLLLFGFILGLVISGVTVFPLPQEVTAICSLLGAPDGASASDYSGGLHWLVQVRNALLATGKSYPFLFYGYDWMAFAHLVIAIAFVGPIKDPVRNKWVLQWALICCGFVIPLALICGAVRGIPSWWQLIDCSFGVVGAVPLIYCLRIIQKLEKRAPRPL